MEIKNKTLFIYNDDHYYEIRRLYDKDDIDGNNMFLVLMIDAYRTPTTGIYSSAYIKNNVYSDEHKRYVNNNDLDLI